MGSDESPRRLNVSTFFPADNDAGTISIGISLFSLVRKV